MNALKITENLSSHTSRFINGLLINGLRLSQQRSKQYMLELCKGSVTGGQSAERAFGDFWIAYIVESGL